MSGNDPAITQVSIYAQKGSSAGWVSGFRGSGAGDRPEFVLTPTFAAASVLDLEPDAHGLIDRMRRSGYALRVCGKLEREAWLYVDVPERREG